MIPIEAAILILVFLIALLALAVLGEQTAWGRRITDALLRRVRGW